MDFVELLIEVDGLLGFGADPANVKKAMALLKKHAPKMGKKPAFLGYVAKAQLLSGNAEASLAAADQMIDLDKAEMYAWGHFWRAAVLAMRNEKAAMLKSLAVAWKRDHDVADEALRQPAFEAFRGDPAFLKAIHRSPGPKLDAKLARLLRMTRNDEPFQTYQAAKKLLDVHEDQASVLDALVGALAEIVDDLDEHGDMNLDDYGRRKISPDAFRAELREAKKQRKALGRKKSAFARALDGA